MADQLENHFSHLKRQEETILNSLMQEVKDIEEVFNRIQVDISILRQTTAIGVESSYVSAYYVSQQYTPVVSVSRRNFAVIFTLDISPSMDERISFFIY